MNHSYITVHTLLQYQDHYPWFEPFGDGHRNLLIYFQDADRQKKHTNESLKELAELLRKDFQVTFYAQDKNAFVKIEITKEWLNVYPLRPYCVKKSIDDNEPSLDIGLYITIALGLCDNSIIYSLETRYLM